MSQLNMSHFPQTPTSYDTASPSDLSENSPSFQCASKFPVAADFASKARGSPTPKKLFGELKRARSTPPGTTNDLRRQKLERDELRELPVTVRFERSWDN